MDDTDLGGGSRSGSKRRAIHFWKPFNDWWRNELQRLGRRPLAEDIARWYIRCADSTWQTGDKPTLQETRIHAKCLRSVDAVRQYFRKYRATKKSNSPDEGDDEDEDGTPPYPASISRRSAELAGTQDDVPQTQPRGKRPRSKKLASVSSSAATGEGQRITPSIDACPAPETPKLALPPQACPPVLMGVEQQHQHQQPNASWTLPGSAGISGNLLGSGYPFPVTAMDMPAMQPALGYAAGPVGRSTGVGAGASFMHLPQPPLGTRLMPTTSAPHAPSSQEHRSQQQQPQQPPQPQPQQPQLGSRPEPGLPFLAPIRTEIAPAPQAVAPQTATPPCPTLPPAFNILGSPLALDDEHFQAELKSLLAPGSGRVGDTTPVLDWTTHVPTPRSLIGLLPGSGAPTPDSIRRLSQALDSDLTRAHPLGQLTNHHHQQQQQQKNQQPNQEQQPSQQQQQQRQPEPPQLGSGAPLCAQPCQQPHQHQNLPGGSQQQIPLPALQQPPPQQPPPQQQQQHGPSSVPSVESTASAHPAAAAAAAAGSAAASAVHTWLPSVNCPRYLSRPSNASTLTPLGALAITPDMYAAATAEAAASAGMIRPELPMAFPDLDMLLSPSSCSTRQQQQQLQPPGGAVPFWSKLASPPRSGSVRHRLSVATDQQLQLPQQQQQQQQQAEGQQQQQPRRKRGRALALHDDSCYQDSPARVELPLLPLDLGLSALQGGGNGASLLPQGCFGQQLGQHNSPLSRLIAGDLALGFAPSWLPDQMGPDFGVQLRGGGLGAPFQH